MKNNIAQDILDFGEVEIESAPILTDISIGVSS